MQKIISIDAVSITSIQDMYDPSLTVKLGGKEQSIRYAAKRGDAAQFSADIIAAIDAGDVVPSPYVTPDPEEVLLANEGAPVVGETTPEDARTVALARLKAKISSELAKTDWYVVRNMDTGADVPPAVSLGRMSWRQLSSDSEAKIYEAPTVTAVRDLYRDSNGNGTPDFLDPSV